MSALHEVSGCSDPHRKADVLFIHGLGGDPFATWRAGRDAYSSWPHWLGAQLPEVGVWTVGYPASATKWSRLRRLLPGGSKQAGHTMAIPDRALQALDQLLSHGIGRRPTVLICHSLGGLIAKALLRKAIDTQVPTTEFQIRAVLFVATPHSGSDIATAVTILRRLLAPTVSIDNLRAEDAGLRDLFEWYRGHAASAGIRTLSYVENRPVAGLLTVVTPTSSHPGVGQPPIMLDEDHFSIAKPSSPASQLYRASIQLVEGCTSEPLVRHDAIILRPTVPPAETNAPADRPPRRWTLALLCVLAISLLAFATSNSFTRDALAHSVKASNRLLEDALFFDSQSFLQVAFDGTPAFPDQDTRWRLVIESLMLPPGIPKYGRMSISQDPHLVPIGRNPRTGLWEFYHWPSGARDSDSLVYDSLQRWGTGGYDGSFSPMPGAGLVLVLIPGVPSGPGAGQNDGWLTAPFFLSKFELTTAQWRRLKSLATTLPAESGNGPIVASDTYPAMYITWFETYVALRTVGLRLPTRAEWMLAAAECMTSPPESVADIANLRDQAAHNARPTQVPDSEDWNDGFSLIAKVGSKRPNSMGLHDVLGNVSEYCSDTILGRLTSGDPGVHVRGIHGLRCVMGGDYTNFLKEAIDEEGTGLVALDVSGRQELSCGVRPALAIRLP